MNRHAEDRHGAVGSTAIGGQPLVANIALPALPGSTTRVGLPMPEIVDRVVAEARLLAEAGFDGVLLQNAGDERISRDGGPETIACLTAIASAVRAEVRCLLGINVLAAGGIPALAVAHAVGAEFVRIKVFVGAVVTASGVVEGHPEEVLDFRQRIGAEAIQVAADVHDRSSWPVGGMPLPEAVSAAHRHGANVLVITGRTPGESLAMARVAREATPGVPIWCGGGVTADNVGEHLTVYDGLIVAKTIKRDEDYASTFDPERVKRFIDAARAGGAAASLGGTDGRTTRALHQDRD